MSRIDVILKMVRRIATAKQADVARLSVQTAVVAAFLLASAVPASAQEAVCATPVGDFTNAAITGLLGLCLALVFIGMIIGFGGRSIAFSGNLMSKLSAMTSNSLVGLLGIVFVAVLFSWMLSYAPINIPQGCVPLGG